MKPLVSVIIPTHNRARVLPRALASVMQQHGAGETFDMEIVVVDDASTDDTPRVVHDYPRARHVRLSTNQGLSAARNAGIAASRGGYLAFLDDDDEWLPEKLRCQVETLERVPGTSVVYGECIVRAGQRTFLVPARGQGVSGDVFDDLLERNLAPIHAFLVRREAVASVGGFDAQLRCFEDHDLWLRLASRTPFLFIPKPVAIYHLALEGMNLSQHALGGAAYASGQILEKIVSLLRTTAAAPPRKQHARGCVEFHTACSLLSAGKTEESVPHLQAALAAVPRESGPCCRLSCMPRIAGLFAVAAESPIETTKVLVRGVERAAQALGMSEGRFVRGILSEVWAQVATDLGFGSRPADREAAYAAGCAVLRRPSILRRRKSLAWLMIRGLMGRRADPMFTILQRRVHRLT